MYNFSFYYEEKGTENSNFKSVETYVTATSGTKELYYEIQKNKIVAVEYTDSSVGPDKETWITTGGSFFPIYINAADKTLANCTFDLLSNPYMLEYSNKGGAEFSWNETSPTTMLPNVTISNGNVYSLYNVTNHYMKLMALDGVIACSWTQKKNQKILLDQSEYTLLYDAGGNLITYLHITSNELEATVN
jgi:hypothetical protein